MANVDGRNTLDAIQLLSQREGGGLFFENRESLFSFDKWLSAANIPDDYKPFVVSVYDTSEQVDEITLILMINPKEMTIGQTQISDSAYTRRGWVNSLWGNQQATMSSSGITAGFYFVTSDFSGGLTNFSRRNSIAYLNLLSLMSIVKNNGYYFMDGQENPNLFKDGKSRVINVMSTIRIQYDGSEYLGSFTSFTLTDTATNPYRMEYNFEFVISSFGMDLQGVEGHVKRDGNETVTTIQYAIQGSNINLEPVVGLSKTELDNYFPAQQPPKNSEDSNDYFLDSSIPVNKTYKPGKGPGVSLNVRAIPGKYGTYINQAVDNASKIYQIDPALVAAVIAQESRGNQVAESDKGAKGLMQMLDSTASDMGVTDIYDPQDNIKGGTKYLAILLKRYNGNVSYALAAYNGGLGNFEKHNKDISKMKPETIDYVEKVSYYYNYYSTGTK